LIIDDNSSAQDRRVLLEMFGAYTLIFKPVEQKGHAKSLNIAVALVQTK
jgi:hypothetical protein